MARKRKDANKRICSASSTKKVAVTSPEIAQIVSAVYTTHLSLPPEWTPAQRQGFLDRTAATLSRQIAELAAQLGSRPCRSGSPATASTRIT